MRKAYKPLTGKNEDDTSFKNRRRIIIELRNELADNGYRQRLKHFAAKPEILDKMISNLTRVLPVNVRYNAETMQFMKRKPPPVLPPPPSFTAWSGLEFSATEIAFGSGDDGDGISASYHDSDNVRRFTAENKPLAWHTGTVAIAVRDMANLVLEHRANGAAAFQVNIVFLGSIRQSHIYKFSAFGGVPSGPACSPVGILPLWLGAFGKRVC